MKHLLLVFQRHNCRCFLGTVHHHDPLRRRPNVLHGMRFGPVLRHRRFGRMESHSLLQRFVGT